MPRRLLAAAVAALLTAGSLLTAQAPQKKAPAAKDTHIDVVFLSETHPLILRVHVRLDDKPLQRAYDDFIDHVYKYSDTNKDGTLTKSEAEALPQPQMLRSGIFGLGGFGPGGMGRTAKLNGSGPSGSVTRADVATYYKDSGFEPFTLNLPGTGPQRGGMVFGGMGMTPKATPAEVGAALLKLLDTDKDGKLSRKELTAAKTVLLARDGDEDEVVSTKEVMGDFSTFDLDGLGGIAFAGDANMGGKQTPSGPVFVATGIAPRDVARRMLERYAKGKKTLTNKDLPLGAEAFAALDQDGNGELDQEELARFAQRAPDAEVVIHIGPPRAGKSPVEVLRPKGWSGPAGLNVRAGHDSVSLEFGRSRLDLRVAEGQTREQYSAFIRMIAGQQFSAADRDNNGYLDEKELGRGGIGGLGGSMKMIDRDGDGKVYEKELMTFLDSVEDLQGRAKSSTASLAYSDSGRGLFELFDVNRDGKLSLREMQALPGLIDALDRDGDGCLSMEEIPHLYQFKFEQGSGSGAVNPFIFFGGMGGQEGPRPRTGRGPEWFQRMDRNRDGDLSRGEFLGSDEVFRRIDADGDGLISAEEATRYDAAQKKGRK